MEINARHVALSFQGALHASRLRPQVKSTQYTSAMTSISHQEQESMSFVQKPAQALSRIRKLANSINAQICSKGALHVLQMAPNARNVVLVTCHTRMAALRNAKRVPCGETLARNAHSPMDAPLVKKDIGTLELVALRFHGDCTNCFRI